MGFIQFSKLAPYLAMFAALSACNMAKLREAPVEGSIVYLPDALYGQADFTTNNRMSLSLSGPAFPTIINGKLFVSDINNMRVLVWNSIPTSNTQPPDFVLGQPNLSTN